MQPWWLITFLADEGELSNPTFAQLLNNHVGVWSRINDLGEKWWKVDAFNPNDAQNVGDFAAALQAFLCNPTIKEGDQEPRISGGPEPLCIALVGDVRVPQTRVFLSALACLFRHRSYDLFSNRALNIVGLLHQPLSVPPSLRHETYRFYTQVNTLMSNETAGMRPFDTLFILQEHNQCSDNGSGYTSLDNMQVCELMVQSLFHLMMGENTELGELHQKHQTSMFSIGATAVYYDWKAHQNEMAKLLGEDLLNTFVEAQSSPFVNVEQARVVASQVRERIELKKLFQRMVLGAGRPSFNYDYRIWRDARDRNGRAISQWALFRKEFYDIYFRQYLKNLPFRVSEYSRIFLQTHLEDFKAFLRDRRAEVWQGREDPPEIGLQQTIRSAVVGVLAGNVGRARTLQQVKRVAAEIKNACSSESILASITELDEFSRLEVFKVPDFLLGFYEKAPDTLTAELEQKLYKDIVDSVRSYIMPTSLFLRAALIGILISVLGYYALDEISPGAIDLEPLLEHPWIVRIFSGLLPLVIAGYYYYFRTLKLLNKKLLTYVAAILRHAQTQAKDNIKREMDRVLKQAQSYCDEIVVWANTLSESVAYPQFQPESYRSTTFQRDVYEALDIPGQPTPSGSLRREASPFQLNITGQTKSYDRFDNMEKIHLLNQLLDSERNGEFLWSLVSTTIPPSAADNNAAQVSELWRDFAEKQYEAMSSRQLDRLLENATVERMKTLGFPPIVITPGEIPIDTSFELKYESPELVADFECSKARCEGGSRSIASLAGFRPLSRIIDVAALRSVALNVNASDIQWSDVPSLFAAANRDNQMPGLKSLVDDSFLSLEEFGQSIAEVRQKLGLRIDTRAEAAPSTSHPSDEERPELEI